MCVVDMHYRCGAECAKDVCGEMRHRCVWRTCTVGVGADMRHRGRVECAEDVGVMCQGCGPNALRMWAEMC